MRLPLDIDGDNHTDLFELATSLSSPLQKPL